MQLGFDKKYVLNCATIQLAGFLMEVGRLERANRASSEYAGSRAMSLHHAPWILIIGGLNQSLFDSTHPYQCSMLG